MAAVAKHHKPDITPDAPLRVLVVDDAPIVCRVVDLVLTEKGAEVETCASGSEALAVLDRNGCDSYDVIISDITMPDISGIDLLRTVRSLDPDLPVALMTGNPDVQTAAQAVEFGAAYYLAKPTEPPRMWEVVSRAGRLRRLARIKRDLQEADGRDRPAGERGTLSLQFDEALGLLEIHFQPIVSYSERRLVAYEVLCRSRSEHLPSPWHLFSTAERLGRVLELGREIRRIAAARIGELDDGVLLFVNLHPEELGDDQLVSSALAAHADRVVLEVTERQTLDSVDDPAGRIAALKEVGFRIAVDDLGAGYAGLSSFVQLEPDVVKVDMSLVRDVDSSPKKLKLIQSLVSLCAEMGTAVVVEGVETPAERDALATTGCAWMQGYLFGRPEPAPQKPKF